MLSKKLFVCFVLGSLNLASQGRTWTDASGRTFEATLVRQEGEKVILNVSGRQRTFQINQLSVNDRGFLKSGGKSTSSNSSQSKNPVSRPLPRSSQIQADTGIRIEQLRVEPENKRWVYGSPNFEFVCDDDLGFAAVRRFAWMFESVWQFCESLPFDVPRLRAQEKIRMKTYLIKEFQDYVRAGGPPNSSGVFIPSRDIVMVPFRSLDLEKRPGLKDANNTLRHEVAHQLMKGQSQQAGWFIEGSAEYVATVPFDRNRLLTDRHLKSVVSYLTAFGWNKRAGRNLGQNITFARLESFMQPNYQRFQAQENAYAYALTLFTYFARLDGNKDGARLSRYVSALQDGRPEADARQFLLDGRSYEQLEKEVAAKWNSHGLRLKFQ